MISCTPSSPGMEHPHAPLVNWIKALSCNLLALWGNKNAGSIRSSTDATLSPGSLRLPPLPELHSATQQQKPLVGIIQNGGPSRITAVIGVDGSRGGGKGTVSISQVLFEHHYPHALGISETKPRISWRFSGDAVNWTQAGYELEITRDGGGGGGGSDMGSKSVPELFSFEGSSDSVLVPWPTVALTPGEQAAIRVRAYGAGKPQDGIIAAEGDGISGQGRKQQPDTEWSEVFHVETGLLTEQDWRGAQMIASSAAVANRSATADVAKQPNLFRKEFDLAADNANSSGGGASVVRARLYITAYGVYEAYINGRRATGDVVLAPGWQQYEHRHVYDTYDVTEHIVNGGQAATGAKNVLGIVVGEGWYVGRLGWNGGVRNIWGDTLGAMALLVVTMDDGTQKVVKTDETWRASTGPVVTSEIYDGEVYDARLEKPVWSTAAAVEAEGWGSVDVLEAPFDRLAAPDGPPIMRTENVELASVITSPSGKTILDFGQNLVGWLHVKVDGPAGHEIKFVHAEVLEHGELATAPLRLAKQTDTIILSGRGPLEWEPSFTYHGFRYVEVTGWPAAHTPLTKDSVRAVVAHSAMERTGYFECSDPLINKLHRNIVWSMRGNFMSVPTDCPQRDERLGWSGDAHAFAPTANYLYDTSGFWRGWMKDVYGEQLVRDGAPPNVIPNFPHVDQIRVSATAVWGDVAIGNPWNTYQTTGDLGMLYEQYAGAKAWLDTGIHREPGAGGGSSSSTSRGGLWDRSLFQFGDWLDPTAPENDAAKAQTNATYVADAYLVGMTKLVAQMAEVLHNNSNNDDNDDDDGVVSQDEAEYYASWADELRVLFQDAWIDEHGMVWNETQTGLALALYFGLFDGLDDASEEASRELASDAAAQRLDAVIRGNECKIGTGFAGTHLLGLALTRHDLTPTFYRLLLQTTVPSWLYQVVMDATTTWERWDSLLPSGDVNGSGMTSFNHYAFGSVGNCIHRVVGGLSPAVPGWKRIRVAVEPPPAGLEGGDGGVISSAKASYLSPYGVVATEWDVITDRESGQRVFRLKVTVPPNAVADVVLPGPAGEEKTVGSGTHEFSTTL